MSLYSRIRETDSKQDKLVKCRISNDKCYRKKIKPEMGWGDHDGLGDRYDRTVFHSFTEVIFEQKSEGGEGAKCRVI